MEKLGILTTSVLLTASLLFYASRPQSDLKTGEVGSQQRIITSFPQIEEKQGHFSPLLMKVNTFVSSF